MNAPLSCFDRSSLHAAGADTEPLLSGPAGVEGCDAGADACVAPHATTFRTNRESTIRFIAAPPRTSLGEHASTVTASTQLPCHRRDLRAVERRLNSSQISVNSAEEVEAHPIASWRTTRSTMLGSELPERESDGRSKAEDHREPDDAEHLRV